VIISPLPSRGRRRSAGLRVRRQRGGCRRRTLASVVELEYNFEPNHGQPRLEGQNSAEREAGNLPTMPVRWAAPSLQAVPGGRRSMASLRAIAAALSKRGIPTAGGRGEW
jgi:hypothetical protein